MYVTGSGVPARGTRVGCFAWWQLADAVAGVCSPSVCWACTPIGVGVVAATATRLMLVPSLGLKCAM